MIEFMTWAKFKAYAAAKSLILLYTDSGSSYSIYAHDGGAQVQVSFLKPSSDATDFEDNYKSSSYEI
jgi:hypothetical protein